MKKVMKRIWMIALLAMMSNGAMADDVTVVISKCDGGTIIVKDATGEPDETTGNTTYTVKSQTVIITVTPAKDYQIDKDHISVIPLRDPASATRNDGDVPSISDPLTLMLVDADGDAIVDGEGKPVSDPDDLTAERYYAFTVPVGLGVLVDATFEEVGRAGTSGTIEGTDVTWAVTGDDDARTLTLGGEGSATIGETAPWDAFKALITNLIVGEAVAELGDDLLSSLTGLTVITLQGEKIVGLNNNSVAGLTVDVVGNLYNEYKSTEGWDKATITSTTGVEMKGVGFGENNNYDTFVSKTAVKVPSVLKAYVITGVDGNKVLLTEIKDGIIPAGVPVLLFSESIDDDDFLTASSSDDGSATQGLLFAAPSGGKPVNLGDVYLLYNDKFYLCQAGTIPEGGIYLDITEKSSSDNTNRSRSVIVIGDGDTTGIDVQSSMFNVQSEEWYDLQGCKVSNPTKKGIYIKNGKKVVIK